MAENVRLEYMKLSELAPWPRNPKQHDLGEIHKSINRFGYVAPVTIDERTGRIAAGHGRVEVLAQKKDAGERPPARIQVGPDGDWLIPVIRGISFNSDAEAEAYMIADNRLTTLGGFNDAMLVDILRDLASGPGLEGVGFDGDDLDSLIAQVEGPLPKEEFKGGYAETEEENAARAAAGQGGHKAMGLREVILLMTEEQHALFLNSVKQLRAEWKLETTALIVLEAFRRAIDPLGDQGSREE